MDERSKTKPAVVSVHVAMCLLRGKPISKPAAYSGKNSLPLLKLGGRLAVPVGRLEQMLGSEISIEQIEQATTWATRAA